LEEVKISLLPLASAVAVSPAFAANTISFPDYGDPTLSCADFSAPTGDETINFRGCTRAAQDRVVHGAEA
jgi:hypothetical protein